MTWSFANSGVDLTDGIMAQQRISCGPGGAPTPKTGVSCLSLVSADQSLCVYPAGIWMEHVVGQFVAHQPPIKPTIKKEEDFFQ